jgi:predicted membrane protein
MWGQPPRLSGGAQLRRWNATFDDPNAAAGPYLGTWPFSVNPEGEVVGAYYDAKNIGHGFLRSRHGNMTTFDAPGAVGGTFIASNNAAGAINGFYADASGNVHGFVRDPRGKTTSFDVPGAVYGTYPYGNNAAGLVMEVGQTRTM